MMDLTEFTQIVDETDIKNGVASAIHRAQLSNWASVTTMDAAGAAITKVVEGAMFATQVEEMDAAERGAFLREIRETLPIELGIRLNGLS